jgi:transposase
MAPKRNKAQIALDRENARRIVCSSEYRCLNSDRERVEHLFVSCGVRQSDIVAVTKLSEATVYRWISKPQTRKRAGRPSYLSEESEKILFEQIVPENHQNHKSMTTQEVVAEV